MNSIDHFHRKVINLLVKQIPTDVQDSIWYGTPAGIHSDLTELVVDKSNFIIVNFDILEHNEFNHTTDSTTQFSQKFLNMVNLYPDTKFILMCQVENAYSELAHPRVQIVRYGTGICREDLEYRSLVPQIEKNFSSKKNFMCLNRNPRQHRINVVSYLLGLDFENYGTISFDKKHAQAPTWLERVSWNLTDLQIQIIKPILVRGYNKLKAMDLGNSLSEVDAIYAQKLDNVANFNHSLRHMYRDHFVELVVETQFNLPFFGASEKFKNSVYGCSFPIVLGGHGVIKFLRDIGFDMFDDVIDHSYDLIQDPLDRMTAAINLNQSLLCDNNLVKALWQTHQHRFLNNIEFIKTKIFDIIEERAYTDFNKLSWN